MLDRPPDAPHRLLIVEDSPSDALVLRADLREGPLAAAEIDEAATLGAALQALAARPYDAVLTDLGLPDSDGLETFDAIAAAAGDAAIVVLTGCDDEQLADAAVRRGAQDYVVKGRPRPGQLTSAVRYAVRRQQLLTELRAARDAQLAQKDSFLSHVSHELRCPLAVVHQFASLLADGVAGELTTAQQELLDVLRRNVEHLGLMIDDLLQVSRAQRDVVVIDAVPIAPGAALEHAAAAFRPRARERGIVIDCDVDDAPEVLADPQRLTEILANLVDNALKFTPGAGRIRLSAEPECGVVRFTVRDTGAGIDPAALPHVFDRFYQADQTDAVSRNGLGLGLFLCRDLVQRQGGEIAVESEPGRGTSVAFTLPVARQLTPAEVPG